MAGKYVWMTGEHEKKDKKSQEKASLKLRTFLRGTFNLLLAKNIWDN